MNYFERLYAFFLQKDEELSKLEQAAKICLITSAESKNIWLAMLAYSLVIQIRSHPNWKPYKKIK